MGVALKKVLLVASAFGFGVAVGAVATAREYARRGIELEKHVPLSKENDGN